MSRRLNERDCRHFASIIIENKHDLYIHANTVARV